MKYLNSIIHVKTKCLFLLLILITEINTNAFAQTYRQQYDKLDQIYYTDDFLDRNNFDEVLHNVTGSLMRSYVIMYRGTADLKYLNKFIVASKRVIDRRDDNWTAIKAYTTHLGSASGTILSNSSYGWSRISGGVVSTRYMETGTITRPMIEFMLLMQEHPELDNTPLPTEVGTPLGQTSFHDYAMWLRSKVVESLNWEYTYHWDQTNEYFGVGISGNSDAEGINQQASLGLAYLLMYKVYINDGLADPGFGIIGKRVATHLYDVMITRGTTNSSSTGGWQSWIGGSTGGASTVIEDVFHARLDDEMAQEMVDQGLNNSSGSPFSGTQMDEVANGFYYHIGAVPRTIYMNVAATNSTCNQACDGSPDDTYYMAGAYAYLCRYYSGIYQEVSDIYSPDQVINGAQNTVFAGAPFDVSGSGGIVMLGLSQLVYHEHLFNPLSVRASAAITTQVGGATSFNFLNSSSTKEIAVANNTAHYIRIYNFDNNYNISAPTDFSISGLSLKGLAASNFDTSTPEDELVAFDAISQKIYIYKKSGTTIALLTSSSALSITAIGLATGEFNSSNPGNEILLVTASGDVSMYKYDATTNTVVALSLSGSATGLANVAGMTVGDFDGNGVDEIALVNNTTGLINTYSITGGNTLQSDAVSSSTGVTNQWNGITSGDFDGDGLNEIMVHRNYDGAFMLYKRSLTNIIYKDMEIFPVSQGNGVMCKTSFVNSLGKDGLVTLRTFDGQVSLFNLDGFCKGLDLNNQTLDATASLGNYYPIDYHVNNLLIAGNNFSIPSPSIVQMSSGKEIRFTDGFTASAGSDVHGYIDSALTCNPDVFLHKQPQPHRNQTREYSSTEKTRPALIDNEIIISPNPNNGNFIVTFTRNDQAITIKEIKVFDIYGKIVWSVGASSNATINIDISSYSAGIYYVRIINTMGEIKMKKFIKQ
ncbi:MAG: repeat-containing protein [Bacteroidetes bacterium]|nr:repeat-containing protein [Bacteroidota bacterium]